MTDLVRRESELILYQTEDGRTRIECRFEGETLWLTQALIAELFQKDVRTINEHLVNIFDEGELSREATIRKLRIVRTEGSRERLRATSSTTTSKRSWRSVTQARRRPLPELRASAAAHGLLAEARR